MLAKYRVRRRERLTRHFNFMNILEKELEDLIFENTKDTSKLVSRGLDFIGKYSIFSRQLDLGSYGIADIVAFGYDPITNSFKKNKHLNICIIELKKDKIDRDTLFQALRYAKGVEAYVSNNYNMACKFELSLIGTSIDLTSDFVYCLDYFENLNVYTTSLNLVDGINFKRHSSYSLTGAREPNIGDGLISLIKSMIIRKTKSLFNYYKQ